MKYRKRVGRKTFLWTPFDPGRDNYYSKVLSSSEQQQKEYYYSLGLNLFPATDDRPFVEHYLQFGKVELDPKLPVEFTHRNGQKWRGVIPRGDFPYVAILVESAALSLLFIALPLLLFARPSVKRRGFLGVLSYFACLGFAFIAVEICLIKRYVLFLGNPAYSITTVLISLLMGAGLGSIAMGKLAKKDSRKLMGFAIPILAAALLCEAFLSPLALNAVLGSTFYTRLAVAVALLLPLGFAMGTPFPLGLSFIREWQIGEEEKKKLVAWAWGMNGYATVVGSASAVFIALFWGFKMLLFSSIAIYLISLFAIRTVKRA